MIKNAKFTIAQSRKTKNPEAHVFSEKKTWTHKREKNNQHIRFHLLEYNRSAPVPSEGFEEWANPSASQGKCLKRHQQQEEVWED